METLAGPSPTEHQQNTKPKTFATWPLATRAETRALVVEKGYTVAKAAQTTGVPVDTATIWSKAEKWVTLKLAYAERQRALQEQRATMPVTLLDVKEPQPAPSQEATKDGRIKAIAEQIDDLDRELADCEDNSERCKLIDAKAKLWGLLYPKPGVLKPRRGDKPAQIQPEPIAAQAPATPMTGLENG